jgi:hypothetical protein
MRNDMQTRSESKIELMKWRFDKHIMSRTQETWIDDYQLVSYMKFVNHMETFILGFHDWSSSKHNVVVDM